jgi:hypothetical protein
VSDYVPADPLDPPMVEVLVDGVWYDGQVRAQELRDGAWVVHAEYRGPKGVYLAVFPSKHVRSDDTDWARGRTG